MRPRGQGARRRGRTRRLGSGDWRRDALEVAALATAALIATAGALGALAEGLAGTGLWSHILPFTAGVLVLGVLAAASFRAWLAGRAWLLRRWRVAPAALACAVGVAALGWSRGAAFHRRVAALQALVGGSAEAERLALAHQVYAAYRRSDPAHLQRILERAQVYEPTVLEAARTFGVDPEVLMGVGAAESAFYPRDSPDGGRGLFQITAPPAETVAAVRRRLHTEELDPLNQRHNAFLAAATLELYLEQMSGDLFLGLLAYNIGPRNGGLLAIMRQYGAHDFVTIQPYLQNLPRDYPVRVLSAALAYRLWRTEGRLPRYEEDGNAAHIQAVGIPGLVPRRS